MDNDRSLSAELGNRSPQPPNTSRIAVDEDNLVCAAGKSFQPDGTATGVKVQAPGLTQAAAKPIEQRFASRIRRRPYPEIRIKSNDAPTPAAGYDSYSALQIEIGRF